MDSSLRTGSQYTCVCEDSPSAEIHPPTHLPHGHQADPPQTAGRFRIGRQDLSGPPVHTRQRPRFSAPVPDAPAASFLLLPCSCHGKADLTGRGRSLATVLGARSNSCGLGESWGSSWEAAAPPRSLRWPAVPGIHPLVPASPPSVPHLSWLFSLYVSYVCVLTRHSYQARSPGIQGPPSSRMTSS